MEADAGWLKELIRDIPDFPRPGVVFKDVTPLLADADALAFCVDALTAPFAGTVTKVAGIEARGFLFAAPAAVRLGAGLVPVRKAGKLPWRTERASYDLEYGSDAVEAHVDAVVPGDRVLIIDDLLATGGTAAATAELMERLGATVMGLRFVVELRFLGGRSKLTGYDVAALINYE
jgi:adenine phosphoribosyltransferase